MVLITKLGKHGAEHRKQWKDTQQANGTHAQGTRNAGVPKIEKVKESQEKIF